MAITTEGTYQDFAYTGGIQTFTVPYDGLYKLEVWGAKGGAFTQWSTVGGNGGYSVGWIYLKKGKTLYIGCGGKGGICPATPADQAVAGGYNGGGTAYVSSSTYAGGGGGGGATHIVLSEAGKGTIAGIGKTNFDKYGLIVAGGGGGAHRNNDQSGLSAGGTGGGTNGGNSTVYYGSNVNTSAGATQTSGYAFGQGANGATGTGARGGGGGGYYGGRTTSNSGGSGGSGWIGGVPTITYKGTTYSPSTSNGQNSGNGKARITFVKKGFPTIVYNGVTLEGLNFNGTEVDTVVFNGVTLE